MKGVKLNLEEIVLWILYGYIVSHPLLELDPILFELLNKNRLQRSSCSIELLRMDNRTFKTEYKTCFRSL